MLHLKQPNNRLRTPLTCKPYPSSSCCITALLCRNLSETLLPKCFVSTTRLQSSRKTPSSGTTATVLYARTRIDRQNESQVGVAGHPRPATPTRSDRWGKRATAQAVRIQAATEPRGTVGGSYPAREAGGGRRGKLREKIESDSSGETKVSEGCLYIIPGILYLVYYTWYIIPLIIIPLAI